MGKRLFAAIDLPESVRNGLAGMDPELQGVRWTSPEQMHLTLGFFGNVSPKAEELLIERLNKIQFGSFFLPLRSVGSFQSRGTPSVIWVGIGSGHPHLFQLHKQVSEAALGAGIEPDLRPWHPHITLARCRGCSTQAVRKFVRENSELDAGMFPVSHFTLYSSRPTPGGSIYHAELLIESRSSRPDA